jgi:DNA-binding IclR family transcriptional regulator
MKRDDGKSASAVEKGIALYLAVLNSGSASLAQLAQQADVPLSTAHRLIGAYVRAGLLVRSARGHYADARQTGSSARETAIQSSRPRLRRFAQDHNVIAHLGVFEGDMVTYLVKERGTAPDILTQETNQLEGYSSAIGKVLLAYLSEAAQTAYLSTGPFVAFTGKTITNPAALRAVLARVHAQGFAVDDAEVDDNLYCLAVPVPRKRDNIEYAISVSSPSQTLMSLALLPRLQACAAEIGASLG